MKKYIISIIVLVLILMGFLINSVIKTQQSRTEEFYNSGYILQALSEGEKADNIEKYYFNGNEKYKKLYNTKIEFKDVNNNEVIANNESFIHYKDNSISSLKKGVIMNLKDIDKDPICYYNIAANKVLKYSGGNYVIQNLSEELSFEEFIYKISDNKYLIAGKLLKLKFSDGTEKEIQDGYIEFQYCDNKIVKLYNQELNYQTVSSDVLIEIGDIKLDLGTTIVSKNSQNKMGLSNMVIDSDDNIEIVDLSQDEEENKEDQEEKEGNEQKNGGQNTGSAIQNGGSSISAGSGDGQTQGIIIGGNGTGTEIPVDETAENSAPIYRIEEFDVDAISLNAKISISGKIESLISENNVKIIENATQKVVYENNHASTEYSIPVNAVTLTPNTEYTLIVKATYKVDEVEYTKNFIYKIFRTYPAGLNVEKDCFTNNSLSFKVSIDSDSKVESAELGLYDTSSNLIDKSDTILRGGSGQETEIVKFEDLNSNTEYEVKLINVKYDGEIIRSGIEEGENYKTLKKTPVVGDTVVEIDKRNSNFILSATNVNDPDKAIQSYRWEIYRLNQEDEEDAEPVYVANSNENVAINVPVDGTKIERKVKYTVKLILTYYDNEKTIEQEIKHGKNISMDSVQFPSVRFEEAKIEEDGVDAITYERIRGNIIIDDSDNAVVRNGNFIVEYTGSIANTKTITYPVPEEGPLVIPIDVNNLRSNETYRFNVRATVDLKEENMAEEDRIIENCYIGGVVIQTKEPYEMVVNSQQISDGENKFAVKMKLSNQDGVTRNLEASTLTGMTIILYPGQDITASKPVKTVTLIDNNEAAYESDLKTQYYDNEGTITPSTLGLQNNDLTDKYYTMLITDGYDYTEHKNKLPIKCEEIHIKTNAVMPDLDDTEKAIEITTIYNKDLDKSEQREGLLGTTIVGYKIKAKFNNNDKIARKVTYKAYDSNTGVSVGEQTFEVGTSGEIPTKTFWLENGTDNSMTDTDMRRGNSYYFTYEAKVDLGDGKEKDYYVTDKETGNKITIFRSEEVKPIKQTATITMYPLVSEFPEGETTGTITFNYTCTDVDNAIDFETPNSKEKGKYMYAYIGKTEKNNQIMSGKTEITFSNLQKGDLSIYIHQRTLKNRVDDPTLLVQQYFEQQTKVEDSVKYSVLDTGLANNKIIIDINSTSTNKLNRVAAYKVVYHADGVNDLVIPFVVPNQNGQIEQDLTKLTEFLNKTVTIDLYAYYDTGIVGYNLESDTYYTYQKSYISSETPNYYYLTTDGILSERNSAQESIYQVSRDDKILLLQNPSTERAGNIELIPSAQGFKYGYDTILQKKLACEQLTSDSNTISFDSIIPGVQFNQVNDQGDLFKEEIDRVSFDADIINPGNIEIKDNLIYIELYETDEKGNTGKLIKTIDDKKIEDFGKEVTIYGLTPAKNYYIQFKATIKGKDGYENRYLYDLSDKYVGKKYYFNTISNVIVSNFEAKYVANSYNEKSIDISFDINPSKGFDEIRYEIRKLNTDTGEYEEDRSIQIPVDEKGDIKKEGNTKDIEKSISANPGSAWEFDKNYQIVIIPIVKYVKDGEETIIKIGTKNEKGVETGIKEFSLDKLREPTVVIKATRSEVDDNKKIDFKITIHDDDKVIKDGKYTIEIMRDGRENITPEESEFNIETLNNTITIDNINEEEFRKSYKITVNYNADYNNSGIESEFVNGSKQYELSAIDDSGISVGNVSVGLNNGKFQLRFTDSYNLNEIKLITYKVALDTQDFSVNETREFNAERNDLQDNTYYYYDLDVQPTQNGFYFIELQFKNEDGHLITTKSLQYIYTK